jgi:hypothetical protein
MRDRNNFKELEGAVELTVKTKCPEKWLLIDRETGQVFQGSNQGHWDRLDPVTKGEQYV